MADSRIATHSTWRVIGKVLKLRARHGEYYKESSIADPCAGAFDPAHSGWPDIEHVLETAP